MTTRKHTGNFVLGTLIGGIIGSIAALLMAPQSGEKTQNMILEKGDSWRQEAEKRMNESRKYADDKIIEARNSVAEWLSKGSTLLDEKSQEIKLEQSKRTAKANPASTA